MTPTCRYQMDPRHTCATNTGQPLREHQTCRAEASAQLAALLAAQLAATASLARQERTEQLADARLTACEHWESELS